MSVLLKLIIAAGVVTVLILYRLYVDRLLLRTRARALQTDKLCEQRGACAGTCTLPSGTATDADAVATIKSPQRSS